MSVGLSFSYIFLLYLSYLLTPRFNVRCSPCLGFALLHCYIHVDSWDWVRNVMQSRSVPAMLPSLSFQIIPYAFQPHLCGTAPRVTTSYDCLVHLFWLCVWIHRLKMTVTTTTLTSQYIFYTTHTQPIY